MSGPPVPESWTSNLAQHAQTLASMAKNIRKSRRMIERAGGDSATRARILQVLVNLQVIQGPLAEASKETEAAIQSINKAIQHKSWSLEA